MEFSILAYIGRLLSSLCEFPVSLLVPLVRVQLSSDCMFKNKCFTVMSIILVCVHRNVLSDGVFIRPFI